MGGLWHCFTHIEWKITRTGKGLFAWTMIDHMVNKHSYHQFINGISHLRDLLGLLITYDSWDDPPSMMNSW